MFQFFISNFLILPSAHFHFFFLFIFVLSSYLLILVVRLVFSHYLSSPSPPVSAPSSSPLLCIVQRSYNENFMFEA